MIHPSTGIDGTGARAGQRILAGMLDAVSPLPSLLIAVLLFLAPLAYEGVTPLSAMVVELCLAVVVLSWAATRLAAPVAAPIGYRGLLWLGAALFLLIVFQLIPLPGTLAATMSSVARGTWRSTWPLLDPSLRPRHLALSASPASTLHGALRFVLVIGLVCVVRDLYRGLRPRHGLVHVMLAAGVLQVLVGVVHLVGHASSIYFLPGGLPGNPHFFGSFISQNRNAAYLNFLWPIAMAMAAEQWLAAASRRSAGAGGPPLLKPDRSLLEPQSYGVVATILIAGVVLCNSRMGWLIILWTALTLPTLFRARCGRPRSAWAAWLSAMAVGGLLGWMVREPLWSTLGRLAEKPRPDLRPLIWQAALKTARDNPWFGTGLETFERAFARYNPVRGYYTFLHADNTYLDLLVELGIPGTLIVLAAIAATGVYIVKSGFWERARGQGVILGLMAGLGGLSIHAIVEDTTRGYGVLIPAATGLGLLLGAVRAPDARHFDTALRYGRTPKRVAVPLALLPVVFTLIVSMNLADRVTQRGREVYHEGRLPALASRLATATRAAPWAAGPMKLLGTIELNAAHHLLTRALDEPSRTARATLSQVPDHLRAAERFFTAAVIRDPLGGNGQRVLSRVAQLRGERRLAKALALDACRVRPGDYRNPRQLARILDWVGEKDNALDAYGDALISAPDATLDSIARAMFDAAGGDPDTVARHLPDTSDWRPYFALGMLIAGEKPFGEAVPWFQQVLSLETPTSRPATQIGYRALAQHDMSLAREAARYLRHRFPADYSGYAIEAKVLEQEGQTERAVETMFEAVRRRTPSVLEELWIVRVLAKAGHTARAYRLLDEMQDRYPGEVRIPMARAKLLWNDGRRSDACEAARSAIDLRPSLEGPRYLLWQFHERLGGHELRTEAARDLEACVALPYAPRCRFEAAKEALRNGKHARAVELLEEAVSQDDGRADFWRLLARAREQAGDAEGAAEAARRAALLGQDKAPHANHEGAAMQR